MSLNDLQNCVDEARRLSKHLFVWDRSGQVGTYFAEFGIHMEFITDMVNVALSTQDKVTGVLDTGLIRLSDSLVTSLQTQMPLLINLGMLSPDFNRVYSHREIFPAETIFDWTQINSRHVHSKFMRNYDALRN